MKFSDKNSLVPAVSSAGVGFHWTTSENQNKFEDCDDEPVTEASAGKASWVRNTVPAGCGMIPLII